MTMKTNDNGVERDMTAAEEAAYLAWAVIAQAEAQAKTEAKAERQVARQAVLDRLGLTEQEAQLLRGS